MRDGTRQLLPAALVLAFGLTLAGCRGCGCGGGGSDNVPANAPPVANAPVEAPAQPAPPEPGALPSAAPIAPASDAGPPLGATASKDSWKTLPPGSIVNIASPEPLQSALSRIPGARLAPLPQDQWQKDVPKEVMDRKLETDRKEMEKSRARAHRKVQNTP